VGPATPGHRHTHHSHGGRGEKTRHDQQDRAWSQWAAVNRKCDSPEQGSDERCARQKGNCHPRKFRRTPGSGGSRAVRVPGVLEHPETPLLSEAWGLAWLPDRLHPPCRAGSERHDGAMAGLVLVERAQR
jgi:hypothetical protein